MAHASFALCSKCRFRAWAWHARHLRYALNADLEHGRGTRGIRTYALNSDLEHGRAAAITIVANSTTYDHSSLGLLASSTNRVTQQSGMQRPTNQSRERNWLRAGNRLRTPLWETLWLTGLSVSKLTFSLRAASTAGL